MLKCFKSLVYVKTLVVLVVCLVKGVKCFKGSWKDVD